MIKSGFAHSKQKQRLMMLGGGPSQIPGILAAQQRGFEVVVADANPQAPGAVLGDDFVKVSTLDIQGCARAARDKNIEAILTMGSDQPVLTAAQVAHTLGIPNPLTPEQALAVTNKVTMKQRLVDSNIPTQPYRALTDNPRTWDPVKELPKPWVIKPADSQGQRGIKLLFTWDQLVEQIPKSLSFSRCNQLIVESYYKSKEITLSGWAPGGSKKPEIWTMSDRITFDPDTWPKAGLGVCLAHRYPSKAAEPFKHEIIEITNQICQFLELKDVPLYFQFLIGDQGPRVNEIACRLGGAYEDQWIPQLTGIDIVEKTLNVYTKPFSTSGNLVTGTKPIQDSTAPYTHGLIPLVFCEPGTIHRIEGINDLEELPGVIACKSLLEPGTVIGPMENSTQRAMYAILLGNSAQEVDQLVDHFFQRLQIIGTDPQGSMRNLLIDTRRDM